MAWSTPRTWVAGEVVTASIMNTHIKAQFDAIALELGTPGTGSEIKLVDGSAATPSLRFNNDVDTGLYSYAANQVGVAAQGAAQVVFTNGTIQPHADNDIDLGTSDYSFKNAYLYALYDETGAARWDMNGQLSAADGSGAAPAYAFTDDLDTGIYRAAANQVGIAANGAGQVLVADGSVLPVADNDIDLGSADYSFKTLFAHSICDEGGNERLDLSAVSWGANDTGGAGYQALVRANPA